MPADVSEQADDMARVALVDLESNVPNIGMMMCTPRFGMSVIASVLAAAGHRPTVLADCYLRGGVGPREILALAPAAVFFNGIGTSMHRVRQCALRLRAAQPGLPIVLGGEIATLVPSTGEDFADVIVVGEGDETALEVLEALLKQRTLSSVAGIRYREGGRWHETPPRPRIRPIRYRLNPDVYRGLRKIASRWLTRTTGMTYGGRLTYFPIQVSRGCTTSCSFCTWRTLFGGGGYVVRELEDVLGDIHRLRHGLQIKRLMVVDNLFGADRDKTLALAEGLLGRYPKPRDRPDLTVLMRADQIGDGGYSESEMALLRRAGVKDVILGLESVDDGALRRLKKGMSLDQYVEAIGILHRAGMRPSGSFGVGGGIDLPQDIRRIAPFSRALGLYRVHVYAFSLFPGTADAQQQQHLVIPGFDQRYANGHGVVIFPRRMLPTELQDEIFDAMNSFCSWLSEEGLFYKLSIRRIRRAMRPHWALLRRLEQQLIADGTYRDRNGYWQLDEDRLRERSAAAPGQRRASDMARARGAGLGQASAVKG